MNYRTWLLIGACAVTGAAQASELPTRVEGLSMLSGAAGGALIGGPPGAIVGFALGAVFGDRVAVAQRAESHAAELETQLAAAEVDLHAARQALAAAAAAAQSNEDAEFLEQLAERLSADVLFRTNSDELEPEAMQRLADLAALLQPIDGITIELHGFADPRGDDAANRDLSARRAERVRDALATGGLDPDRTRVIAHGEELSTAAQGDSDAYAWERRVRVGVATAGNTAVARAGDPML